MSESQNSVGNSVDNSGDEATRPGRNGGKLRAGGKKGNRGGRPPNEFRDKMRELASAARSEAYLAKCLRGEFGPKIFLAAHRHASDRGYGKPTQPLEHSGKDGGPIHTTTDLTGLPVSDLLALRNKLLAGEEAE